jgi:hypothetical protein
MVAALVVQAYGTAPPQQCRPSRRRTRLGERGSCSRVCPSGTLATQPRIGGPGWLGPGASRWTKQKATRVLPAEYDQGKASLDALIDWEDANAQGAKRNEATTRLHLIDQLLIEVLRWPRHVVRVEEPSGSGRIDYSLGAPAAQFIVEAKREGDTFDLPAGVRTGVHSIESLTDRPSGRSLRQAMIQVSEYAARNGVAMAGVTNGHQLVLFIATRADGVPPLKGKALVLPSLVWPTCARIFASSGIAPLHRQWTKELCTEHCG